MSRCLYCNNITKNPKFCSRSCSTKISNKNPKRKTKKWIQENYEYAKNQAKWKAAKEYCDDRMMEFKILTEEELGI